MITIKNILTPNEILRYNKEWKNFREKYKLNNEYNTHSGKPIISKIYHFKDKPIFRAHVFSRKKKKKQLRGHDPYFVSNYHLMPFWHISHYLTPLEQLYHASMHLIRDHQKYGVKEYFLEFKMSETISWYTSVSVELIHKTIRKSKKYEIEDCVFTLYDDINKKIKGRISARTLVQLRDYVEYIEEIKEGNPEVLEKLIRKIEMQNANHKRLIKPRKNLQTTKDYLIEQLKQGKIPEEELHDFFSLWDKE